MLFTRVFILSQSLESHAIRNYQELNKLKKGSGRQFRMQVFREKGTLILFQNTRFEIPAFEIVFFLMKKCSFLSFHKEFLSVKTISIIPLFMPS